MRQEQRNALAALAAALALAAVPAAAQGNRTAGRTAQAATAAADAGYKAFARQDYAQAVASAQRAVQLAPLRRDYWLLLAQALAADGQGDAAQQALERAARVRGDDAALARARSQLAAIRAQAAGAAMYQALEAGDVKAAIAQGSEAVRWAPENTGYRLVLVHALLRDGRYADADQAASEAVALLPDSAAPLALRAYARQGLGRPAEATADLQRALQQPGVPAAARRELQLLAADLALAQGDAPRALQALAALPADDAEAAARRELARQRAAGAAPTFALRAPGIDCSDVQASQACTLQAAALPPQPGFVNATAAYRALEQQDLQRALQQARLATAASPAQRDWQLLHMNAALAAGELAEAERAASAALALGSDARTLAQRSSIRQRLGDAAGADADARAALQAGTLPPTDLAYLSTRIGDDEAARRAFAAADAAGGLPPTSLLDAGYAAMRSRHDDEAVGYFKRAVDAANGLQLKLDPQMVYDTRRTIADVSRKWGVLASITSRNGSGVVPSFGAVGGGSPGQRVTQAGVEAYYRPWGFRNGQFVEAFVRGFATLDDQAGGNTGGDSFAGAIGARWKPLTSQNLVLSLARTFGPNVDDDWLAQIGWSWDHGTDLRMNQSSWWTTRLYAEAGRYLGNDVNYGIASAMVGRSYVVGSDGRTVLFPHLFAGAEYSSDSPGDKSSFGAGPGLSLRHWFREDVYNAPRSYWDFTVQYRAHLGGDDRMKGLYVNGLLSY